MKAINGTAVAVGLLFAGVVFAQESENSPIVSNVPPPAKVEKLIKIRDLESLTIGSLRKQFPQLPGMFASVHSCRLPDYGPFVSVVLQLPANVLTRPVLVELERRHRLAEQRARKMRDQIEKAAQLITLRIRESGLQERIQEEHASKKKSRQSVIEDLERDLADVRNSIETLEDGSMKISFSDASDTITDVDLNKMMIENYNQVIQRVSDAMKDALAENAPRLTGLDEGERISIHTVIRENLLGNQGRSILFSLYESDVAAFKRGELELSALKNKITVRADNRD